MSGGEQQRVSIAVALANDPEVVFADEPTGELDSGTSQQVFDALRTANSELGVSIVVVTHDHEVTEQVQRTVEIRDGRTSSEVLRRSGEGGGPAEQFAVLDRAGRVQLPREYIEELRMRDRVRLAKDPDHIGVWPDLGSAAHTPTREGGDAVRNMIEVEGLTRTFGSGGTAVHAVDDVSFTVPEGQLCAVVGRSGSGKTTLLNLIGGLDKPDAGRITVDGKQLAGPGRSLGEKELAALRRDLFGFVFQSFALIPILSAAENVGIPLRLRKTAVAAREERVELLLNMVGLSAHMKQRPGELSGGQQQRVALARALANSPRVLIADEPTGQLDSETGRAVMRLLRAVVAAENVTALVATHDPLMMEMADRVITIGDGRLVGDSTPIGDVEARRRSGGIGRPRGGMALRLGRGCRVCPACRTPPSVRSCNG